jgi:predicted MFS family arabinose efflux permease
MLIARLLSGILTQYTTWRSIYWFSLGVQYLIVILLFFYLPDYPSTNPGGLNYFSMLYSIIKMLFKYPQLVQACVIGFLGSSTFTSFWTTLTFLLSAPPYSYTPATIGLFALIGIGAMIFGPLYSRVIIDRFVPFYSVVLGLSYLLIGNLVGTFTGRTSVAGPIIQAFAIDLGLQTSQIANRSAIYAIEPLARNRVNTAYMLSVFCGQLTGTAVGNALYARGGWVRSGGANVGFIGAAFVVCFARGPWEKRWLGWRGGWGMRRRDLGAASAQERPAIEQALDEISAEEQGVIARQDENATTSDEKIVGNEKKEEYNDRDELMQ